VYVAWSLWGQKGKSRVAHFSNLISESVRQTLRFGDYGIARVGHGEFIQSRGIEVLKKLSGQRFRF
jgi:hypothetical protein